MTTLRTCPVCGGRELESFCEAEDRLRIGPDPVYRILRCPDCGLGLTHPWIDPSRIGRWYPDGYYGEVERPIAELLDGSWQGTSSWRGEWEKAKLVERYRSTGRLLDVGCAEGKFLWVLDPARWQRWGLEFNVELVERVQGRVPQVRLLAGGIEDLDPGAHQFDVVTMWHVFEHLPDPAATLDALRRLVTTGGFLFISLPRFDSVQARLFRRDWYPFTDVPRHYYHYSRAALERLLVSRGWEPLHCIFFSRAVNFHCWKYSLRSVASRRWGSGKLYYPLKPLLHVAALVEGVTHAFGTMTWVARRPAG
ncbi:MAG: hypothetical protein Kow001_00380 [Acidobacteriota bacterium]